MKKYWILFFLFYSPLLFCQEKIFFSRMDLSLRLSTVGIGVEASSILHNQVNGRLGINLLFYDINDIHVPIKVDIGSISEYFGYVPDLNIKTSVEMIHSHILFDFYPVRNGKFHLTAGAFLGVNTLNISGNLIDKNKEPAELLPGYEWPDLRSGDMFIEVNEGIVDMELLLGNAIKPYLGIGFSNFKLNDDVNMKFELGIIYQGKYTFLQDDRIVMMNKEYMSYFGDLLKLEKWLKWYGVLNIQFNFRLF